MRAVIDTNVLVSGILNPHGAPGRIVEAITARALSVLHDDRILHEYREVLHRSQFGFRASDIDALLDFIEDIGEHISTRDLGFALPDPSDVPLLEVAELGRADALITGNLRHFQTKRGVYKTVICKPADFLKRFHLVG